MSLEELTAKTIRDLLPVFGIPNDSRTCACPACGAERRGKSERRYAFGLRGDGRGGKCHRCSFSADVVKFAQQFLLGRVISPGDRVGFGEFCRAAERAGIMTPREDPTDHLRPRSNAEPKRWKAAEPIAPEVRERPPIAEVRNVWEACGIASADAEVSSWARSRGLDPALMTELDLFRALPPGEDPGFPWLRPWMIATRRAVFPVWDEDGALCSLRFRAICEVRGPKSTGPNGNWDVRRDVRLPDSIVIDSKTGKPVGLAYALGGAVLANDAALGLLRRTSTVDTVLVCEGEPDFATAVQTFSGRPNPPAIFGIWSGAWSPELALRVPSGARVILRVHPDSAGEAFAHSIAQTLKGRCQVGRSKPLTPEHSPDAAAENRRSEEAPR